MARTARDGQQGGRKRGASAQRRERRTAHTPAAHTPAQSSARSRQRGTGAAREAATPVGKGCSGAASAAQPEPASAPHVTVAVEFDAAGVPLCVGAIPARARAYWREAAL